MKKNDLTGRRFGRLLVYDMSNKKFKVDKLREEIKELRKEVRNG